MDSKYIIVEESSYEDALSKGLSILNLTKDEVDIEVLDTKKSILFKKGYCKLKITPGTIIKKMEQVSSRNEDIIEKVKMEDEFHLDYRSDGVYLTILTDSGINVSDISDFLSKRSVKDCDYDEIARLVEDERGIAKKIAPYQEKILVDSTLQINVSKTKLEASISITEPIGGKMFSTADIIQDLNREGIVFGIDKKKIEEMIEYNIFNQNMMIAQGKLPLNGDDAKIIYAFDNKSHTSVPGTIIEEDGRIDYKNLNKIRNVKAGDLLIEIIPATEGITGTDVYGNEIAAKEGNPAIVKKGKNVEESEDGLKIHATENGEVCFEDNTVHVNENITVNGNVDNETGNIQFNGKININGSVRSGFKVEAEGDIEVFGVVEGATLISKGNIIIHRGVQGNNQAYLHCLGDFKSKYVENANIRSAGNVEADVILHSDVIAKNKVIASGRKALIVGGSIRAGKEVRAGILGSGMGTITVIEVGIDPEEKDNYEQLKAKVASIEKNIESSKKAIDLLSRMSKRQKLAKNKEELLVKSLNTYEVLKKKHSFLTKELQVLSEKLKDSSSGKIHGSKTIYSGVRVIIGSSAKQIYDELHNSTLYVEDGEIVIGSYER
ncbi:MAG TPA: FapA family protein [Oscillospiraceae bacterium]|nr:FapA family protein [Oscillospiraceae bacterium]